jgi:predicted AlkP superfamily pyrophosphatase or phosphodiesterase
MKAHQFLRLVISTLAVALLASCAAPPGAAPRPKLVELLVVDGLPQRQVLDYRDQLAPDGFARFLDRGAWFANAHYGHAFTVTAAGHATMLTGAYPHRTGIIGNDWRDPVTAEPVYCTSDTSATYIGHATNALDGTSPKNLKAETVGDVLRRADTRSKVIGISGKDRGAILPAGKTGTAYMYMGATGQFASSTHYMAAHPAWVDTFNAGKPADRYFKTEWKALLPEAAYARSVPDQQKWYGPAGGGLPALYGAPDDATPGARFYTSLLRGPYVDAMSLDFARAAIAGERLGQGDTPDILSVSLSGHDYVNHAFSAESRLSHDHLLQLDRLLQAFFQDLDARIGKDNYLAVLTADHGFMPSPEHNASQGREAGRVNSGQVLARLNAGLEKRFGEGKWAAGYSGSSVLFNKSLIAQKQVDANALAEETRALLMAEPGFAAAYTRRELASGSRAGAPHFEQMQKSWHADVSGDVQYSLKPGWMFGNTVATHGSPHPYDTQVPILMYGPAWVKPGRVDARVEVVDIAPTLSRVLRIAPPSSAEGKLLPLQGL